MIDEDTWKRAQELLEEGRSRNAKKGINQYLLSRRLTCGFCGGAVSGKPSTGVSNGGKGKVRVTYLNYVCSNSMGQNRLWRKTCDNKCYRCELVDREAWKWIVNLIAHPRETFGAYRSAQSMSAEDIALIRGEIGRYEGQIEKYRKKLDKYQELFVEELIDKGDFRAKKKEIDQNIVDAQAQIAALNEKLDEVAITDEQIARIEGYCQHLQKHLDRADETPFETRREILEAFGIFGKLAIEDGQKVLYLNWAIYETRIPLDRLDLTGSEPRTHRLAEPQSGDAPVFAQSSGGIRC